MKALDATPASSDLGVQYGLTPAEHRVVAQAARGLTVRKIAAEIGRSEQTIKNQLGSIYQKMGIGTREELLNLIDIRRPHWITCPACNGCGEVLKKPEGEQS